MIEIGSTVFTATSPWMSVQEFSSGGQWARCYWFEFTTLNEDWFHISELSEILTQEIEFPEDPVGDLVERINGDTDFFWDTVEDYKKAEAKELEQAGARAQIEYLLTQGLELSELESWIEEYENEN